MFRQPLRVRPIPHPLDQRRISIFLFLRRRRQQGGWPFCADLRMHDLQQPRRMRSSRPIVQRQPLSDIRCGEWDFSCCCCSCGRRREDVSECQGQCVRVVESQRASGSESPAVGMRGVADESDAGRTNPTGEGIAGEVGVQLGLRGEVR